MEAGFTNFYPRSPCGERRKTTTQHIAKFLFLSTLSLRRATVKLFYKLAGIHDFYPRSPCGERRPQLSNSSRLILFLSTLSLRRATLRVLDGSKSSIISIHALLAESDVTLQNTHHFSALFLSTLSLRRATLSIPIIGFSGRVFLSTLSLRRATHYDNYNLHCVEISIHALLAESDGLFYVI